MSSSLEAKIVVLGAQGVGKTSLVHRYTQNTFTPTKQSTVGASFVTKRVLDSTSDTLVRLQIWDTAGQERFRSISRLYYRGANACLLCYDITDERSFVEMMGWLEELRRNIGPDTGGSEDGRIVIHVVGTKSDIVADDPTKRAVPFERTIAYIAEQLYPSRASTPPPSATPLATPGATVTGLGGVGRSSSVTIGMGMGVDSKRSSGFWGQDIGWDCCHEISAKDGEGVEEVFRVIARKLVEQRSRREAEALGMVFTPGISSSIFDGGGASASTPGVGVDSGGSFRLGMNDKRRSWLMFPPSSAGDEGDEAVEVVQKRGGRCC